MIDDKEHNNQEELHEEFEEEFEIEDDVLTPENEIGHELDDAAAPAKTQRTSMLLPILIGAGILGFIGWKVYGIFKTTQATQAIASAKKAADEELPEPASANEVASGETTGTAKLPEPVKPAEHLKAIEAAKPMAPITPAEPAKPIEPIKPGEPVKPIEPIKPVEPINPIEPVKPLEPVKPIEPIKPAAPVMPSKPLAPSIPAQSLEIAPPAPNANAPSKLLEPSSTGITTNKALAPSKEIEPVRSMPAAPAPSNVTPVTAPAPTPPAPPSVEAQVSPSAQTVILLNDQLKQMQKNLELQEQYYQKQIKDLEGDVKSSSENSVNATKSVSALQHDVASLSSTIRTLTQEISALRETQKNHVRAKTDETAPRVSTKAPARKAKVKAPTEYVEYSELPSYEEPRHAAKHHHAAASNSATSNLAIHAIIPGRAWLRSPDGKTISVSEGDPVNGLGKIIKIDAYNGVVVTSSGAILR